MSDNLEIIQTRWRAEFADRNYYAITLECEYKLSREFIELVPFLDYVHRTTTGTFARSTYKDSFVLDTGDVVVLLEKAPSLCSRSDNVDQ